MPNVSHVEYQLPTALLATEQQQEVLYTSIMETVSSEHFALLEHIQKILSSNVHLVTHRAYIAQREETVSVLNV